MTPRVSLLEKHHLRLITAEPVSWHLQPSMWPAELKYWPFWKRFGQEWWEAAPVAELPEMLCSSFAALSSLRAHGAFTMRRGGLAELLSFPRQLCLPASAPSVLGHSGKELCSPNCTWTQEWNFGVCFRAVTRALPTGDISGFVLVCGWCRGVIVHTSCCFLGMFS